MANVVTVAGLSVALLAGCTLDRLGRLDSASENASENAAAGAGGVNAVGGAAGGSALGGGDVTGGQGGSAQGGAGQGGVVGRGGAGATPNPTWQVVDTLSVPVDGSTVLSTFVLESGVTYRLVASGTFVTNPSSNWEGDAEFYDFSSPNDTVSGIDVGIAVDDPIMDLNRTPKWGAYQGNHVYEVSFVGKGATIAVSYHDGNHANNSGAMTLDILAL